MSERHDFFILFQSFKKTTVSMKIRAIDVEISNVHLRKCLLTIPLRVGGEMKACDCSALLVHRQWYIITWK